MKKNSSSVHLLNSAKKLALVCITVISCCCYLNIYAGTDNDKWTLEFHAGNFISTPIENPSDNYSYFTDVMCPSDISIDCEDDTSPSNTGEPIVPTIKGDYILTFEDLVLVGCPTEIIRTFTIDYTNELPNDECSHSISLIDNDAPVFIPQVSDMTVQCDGDVPEIPDVTLEDCDANADLFFFQSIALPGAEKCLLTNAVGVNPNVWALWLPGLPGGYTDSFVFDENNPGCMNVYDDGSALLTGQVHASNNPNQIFNMNIRIENKLSWTEWHALNTLTPPFVPRSFKDDTGLGALGGDLWQFWDYYVLDEESSFLFGAGDFAGSLLQLVQAPANLFFGFQVGQAANNKNENYGLSSWFSYNGHLTVNGVNLPVSNIGDFNMDADCQPIPDDVCITTIERHWIAIDQCGNADEMFQTITIQDDEGPVMSMCPADVTVQCDAIPSVPAITADDNCIGTVPVDFEETVEAGGCPNASIITRTWTAQDNCDNITICKQVITIIDTTPPVLSGDPQDLTVECDDPIPPAAILTASDNCDNDVPVMMASSITNDVECPNVQIIHRTWTATDDCDNSVTVDQNIVIQDNTPPAITCPVNLTVSCELVGNTDFGFATAIDNCDPSPSVFQIEVLSQIGNCPQEEILEIIWGAEDECENSSICSQFVNVVDTQAPVITCPADFTVDCNEGSDPFFTGSATATDNCGNPIITFTDGPLSGDCPSSFIRTWTASDECDNTSSCDQTITIDDDTAPEVFCPQPLNLDCTEDVPPANIQLVEWVDDCSDVVITHVGDVASGDCPITILRTYMATDACNNSATCVQTIIINDNTPPNITCPAALTVECVGDVPSPNSNSVSANDACGNVEVVHTGDTSVGNCPIIITRTYTASDACGNVASCTQTITVLDQTPPTATCPGPLTVECLSEVPGANVNSVTVSDNCPGDVTVLHLGDEPQQGECPIVLIRIYQVTDACANSATCTQNITIDDQTPPSIQCPADIEVACEDGIPAPNPDAVIATDNCGSVTVTYEGQVIENSVCPLVITRTYKATDACGNSSTCTQTIMSIDEQAPVLSGGDMGEITLECDQILIDVIWPTAEDNCTEEIGISLDIEFIPGACENEHTDIYMWSATDECGNVSTQSFTVNYVDTTVPVLEGCPENITLECSDPLPNPADVTATDNCDDDVEILFLETGGPNNANENCNLTSAIGPGPDFWSIWLPNLPGGITDQFVFDSPPGGNLSLTGDEGVISGKVHADDNPDQIFNVHIKLMDKMNWDEWSSLSTTSPPFVNRSFKDDAGYAAQGGNLWEFWEFFVIDPSQSFLVGEGDFSGSFLLLEQAPANLFFGVQLGQAANNKNENYGLSTWFRYTGSLLGNNVSGIGDVNVDAVCGFEVETCTYDITRTWLATDNCGNSAICVQDITIVDTTPPVFDEEPQDITIECDQVNDPIAQVPVCTATDLCNEPVTITLEVDTFPGNCPNNYVISRKWTAIDNCDNEAIKNQLVTVLDTTPPTITAAADVTIECGTDLPAPDATATDNCGDADWSVTALVTPGCGETFVMVRTYTAIDECDNTATATQTITVVDTTPPTITAAADVTIECGTDLPAPDATADDTCGDADWDVTAVVTPGCGETFIMVRTYTAIDECDNTATATQTITVVDTTPPTITAAADVTIECGTDLPAPDATADDTCGDADWDVTAVVTPGCGETFVMVRTYTAIDECDNTATTTQTITVVDTTDPVFNNTPADITVECDNIPPQPSVTAEDSCGEASVTLSAFGYNGTDCSGELTRIWTATDECGNSIMHTQIVTIEDNTDPEIVAAPDVTIECGEPLPAPDATATDNCGDATWSVSATQTPGCGETFVMVRTYTATDECDNTATATQTITVVDTTPPTITAAADVTIECGTDLPAPDATADDTCGDADWDVTAVVTPGCGETFIMVRTYTAIDECDNTATATQTITVVDTTPPTITAAADVTIECGTDLPAPDATADDTCGDADWDVTAVVTPGCGETFVMVRTYTAIDECDNTATTTQTITVVDTTDPVFNNTPADITVECDNIPPQPSVTAEDSCGEASVTLSAFGYNGTDCSGELTRIWTATDECGNSIMHTQIVTIEDNTDPEIVATPDVTIECGEPLPAPDATATDNCGDATWSVSATQTPGCGETFVMVRTYTATDECDNTATATQTITVVDNTPPVFVNPPGDGVIPCDSIPDPGIVTASDNCDSSVLVTFISDVFSGSCPGTIVTTWTATDDCGNQSTYQQILTLTDDTPPVLIGVPDDITIECNEDLPAVPQILAEDNCDPDVPVDYSDETLLGDCPQESTIIRTWTAEDECENIVTASQTITIVDTTAPEFTSFPADITVECDAVPDPGNATADDNCGSVTISYGEIVIPGACENAYVIERTWTATDECENSSSVTQEVTVQDTTPPEFMDVPDDVTAECDDVPRADDLIAVDNCDGEVLVEFNEQLIPGDCIGSYTLIRTWTASDNCDNETIVTQTVVVSDNTPPTFEGNLPQDITVECDNVPAPAPELPTLDNCDPNPTQTWNELFIEGNCTDAYQIVWTWTATDDCGNFSQYQQVVTVVDTTDPEFVENLPQNMTVQCDAVPPMTECTATDNCDSNVLVISEENTIEGNCEDNYTIERYWYAEDNCGNYVEHFQTITVIDTENPVLSDLPADMNAPCDDIPDAPVLTATDNCDTDVEVTYVENTLTVGCAGTIERVWLAEDNCGNTTTHIQTITLVDLVGPGLTGVPADVTIECDQSLPEIPNVTALDNCNGPLIPSFIESIVPGSCPQEMTIVRTWIAVDNCDNETMASQTIEVVDTTTPTLNMPDITFAEVECSVIDPVTTNAYYNGELTPAEEEAYINEVIAVFTQLGLVPLGANDNCGNTTIFESSIVILGCDAEEVLCPSVGHLTCVFYAEDECGNQSSEASTSISIIDEDAPVLSGVPANISVSCETVPGPATVTSDDACFGELDVEFDQVIIPGQCTGQYTIIRTWWSADKCENLATGEQIIDVYDNTPPVFTSPLPQDEEVECDAIPEAPAEGDITASDNCGPVTITFTEQNVDGDCIDSYTIIRTWTAMDDCGNSVSHSQNIFVDDTTPPVFDFLPENITVECDDIPDSDLVTASDNCDNDVEVIYDTTFFSGACLGTIERIWTAIDNCGNEALHIQYVTLQDNTPPVLSGTPSDITIECDQPIPAPAPVSIDDNCDPEPSLSLSQTSTPGDCPQESVITRTWVGEDNCDNMVTHVQTINIVDTTSPTITAAADVTIECGSDLPAPDATADDACGDADWDVSAVITPGCGETFVMVRTYTATDECGNTSEDTQTITVVDTTDPVFNNTPADVTVECDNLPSQPSVTAEDLCGDVTVTLSAFGYNGTDCSGQLTRIWTATDECGNSITHTQIVTIEDTTDPAFVGILPGDINAECDDLPAPAVLSAEDNCDDDVDITVSDSNLPGDCIDSYTIVRTYTAIDDCENTSTYVQNIFVDDTTPPTFDSTPGDMMVPCDDLPDPLVLTASDNCDNSVTVTFNETEFNGGCLSIFKRDWTAVDNCGNTSMWTQYISLQDEVNPVLGDTPGDITIECDQDIPSEPNITATDNCDLDVDVDLEEETILVNCIGSYTLTRTWTATDDCGNSSSASQAITVEDTTAPVIDALDLEFAIKSCDEVDYGLFTAFEAGELSFADSLDYLDFLHSLMESCGLAPLGAFDNCSYGEISVLMTQTLGASAVDCPEKGRFTVYWQAVDDCGNLSEIVSKYITIVDEVAPVLIGVPESTSASCDMIPGPADVTAEDNCDIPLVEMSEAIAPGQCDNSFTITRTWTATDDCGNSSMASQEISVYDLTAPVLMGGPDDTTAECDNVPLAATLTATDNCDDDVDIVVSDNVIPGNCEDSYTIERTWTAIDNCGNSSSYTQVIEVSDTTLPVFDQIPMNITVDCDNVPEPEVVTATDNCDNDVHVEFDEILFSGSCLGTYERTWTASDNCGNTVVTVQYVSLEDNQAPVFVDPPADITVDCNGVPPAEECFATDNCNGEITYGYTSQDEGDNCFATITRTWTATDECQNVATHVQTITVIDDIPPIIIEGPADVTVSCDDIPEVPVLNGFDNCSVPGVTLTSEVISDGCPYTITRTWTAEDACENTSVHVQVVTVVDVEDPTFDNLPGDITVDCALIPDPETVTASDNCDDNVSITFSQLENTSDPCALVFTREWTATDNCGNSVVHSQTVTAVDTTAPVFDPNSVPASTTAECDDLPPVVVPTATDDCQVQVSITMDNDTEPIDDCTYLLIRTWTASDGCGNSSSVSQVITVEDTTAPVFTSFPADATFTCGDEIPPTEEPIASDNCNAVSYNLVETIEGNTNPFKDCSLTTPIDVLGDVWAVWLPNLPGSTGNFVFDADGGQFTEVYLGGDEFEATLTGRVYDENDPTKIWRIETKVINKVDWDTWSNSLTIAPPFVNRSFKDDAGYAVGGGNLQETWDFWVIDGANSTLIGEGAYAGDILHLTQAPGNLYYGFQVGQAANNRNAAFGGSSWFSYTGTFDGTSISGIGDFGFEADCPPCEYIITREWTATDACGNSVTQTQEITVNAPSPNVIDGGIDNDFDTDFTNVFDAVEGQIKLIASPNPALEKSVIIYNIPHDDQVRLELYDLSGSLVRHMYSGFATGGVDHRYHLDASNIPNGIYIYRLTTSSAVANEKLILTK